MSGLRLGCWLGIMLLGWRIDASAIRGRLEMTRRFVAGSLLAIALFLSPLFAPQAKAATVPNIFYKTCSYITGRCTPYVQTNRPNPNVGRANYTTWCWCWIW